MKQLISSKIGSWLAPAFSLLLIVISAFVLTMLVSRSVPAQDSDPASMPEVGVGQDVAYFAGGCFWCLEADMEKLPGVISAVSGYCGGDKPDPTYALVSSGSTQYRESLMVVYDVRQLSYADLLNYFWAHVNPTDAGGQFVDRGHQYSTAIFFTTAQQQRIAEASRDAVDTAAIFPSKIKTKIVAFKKFYPAETYHQDYYKKNPGNYKRYRDGSGRNPHIQKYSEKVRGLRSDKTYNKESDADLRKRLTPLQYQVTQQSATEQSFSNPYWDNKAAGIYVDIVTGEPLFSSTDKFKSGTGWPSFTRALQPQHIVETDDHKLGMVRTEVHSRDGHSHLGHLFDDGPAPTHLRYCMDSAALRFIPSDQLAEAGYPEYAGLFQSSK